MRGLTVLDASRSVAGAYCSRLLATLGAEVTCLEPPGGHPLRTAPPWITTPKDGEPMSAAWAYLAAGKRSVVGGVDGPILEALAADVDLVVLSADGDPDLVRARADRLVAANPALVVTVVSGFGLSGPYAGYRSSPLVDWAMGGHLLLNGERHREPLSGAGPWSSYLGGATATLASQAAVIRARRHGHGDVVDVSNMEAAAACHQWTLTIWTHQGVRKTRWGNHHGEAHHPLALFRCTDGWIVVGAVTRPQWEGLCIVTDAVELLADDELFVPAQRFDRSEEIDAAISPWLAAHSRAEAVALLQEHRCPAGQVLALDEVLHSPQLQARAFWSVPDGMGPGARIPGPPFTIGSNQVTLAAAPRLGQHQDQYQGVRT
ncbi:MAG: CaiB/BaiF CoA transferase family protein [Acidimicrobiales bacterium]